MRQTFKGSGLEVRVWKASQSRQACARQGSGVQCVREAYVSQGKGNGVRPVAYTGP